MRYNACRMDGRTSAFASLICPICETPHMPPLRMYVRLQVLPPTSCAEAQRTSIWTSWLRHPSQHSASPWGTANSTQAEAGLSSISEHLGNLKKGTSLALKCRSYLGSTLDTKTANTIPEWNYISKARENPVVHRF